jgi:hypothetical protein
MTHCLGFIHTMDVRKFDPLGIFWLEFHRLSSSFQQTRILERERQERQDAWL